MTPNPSDVTPAEQAGLQTRALPSGRTLVVKADGQTEEIEIRSSGGEIELRIALTKSGPVLSLTGARLEINATESLAVNCKQLSLRAAEGMLLDAGGDIALRSGNETRLRSAGDTYVDGKLVLLNCLDRTGYPDDPAAALAPPADGEAHGKEVEER